MNKPWLKPGLTAVASLLALWGVVEGTRLVAYPDSGGVPTICKGETQGVYLGMTLTQAQCDAWDTAQGQHELALVDSMTYVHQPDPRRVAMADFIHNEGAGALRGSTALRLINRGEIRPGCLAMQRWTLAHDAQHRPIHPKGLKVRRGFDIELCLQGVPKQ